MQNYVFSIFTRGFVAISGFLVFLITAKIFGAEGRGAIAYGTSLFAASGILLSCSLGRVFLKQTLQVDELKIKLLSDFISFNIVISVLTIATSLTYWLMSTSAKEILTFSQILGFSAVSFFYVWFHNGHPIFATFSQTNTQDKIIASVRFVLVIFLILSWALKLENIDYFIWFYSVLLFLGSLAEILILKKNSPYKLFDFKNISIHFI